MIAFYFQLIDFVVLTTGLGIFFGGLDDLFIDACYWTRRLRQRLGHVQAEPSVRVAQLLAVPQRHLAIMVPAWKEADVIASMARNTLRTLDYQDYVVFLGTYRNDPETTAQADAMVHADPARVVRAHVDRDGPTNKADCLNWIAQAIAAYEARNGIEFAGVVMHDCEDVVHPLELRYFNYRLDTADLIQLPVMSLQLPWNAWVGAAYLDDFSESHQKDLLVRQQLTGIVPGAGVALCYSRRAMKAMAERYQGQPFNSSSLTEDYDFSFRLAALGGMTQVFGGEPVHQEPEPNAFAPPLTATAAAAGQIAPSASSPASPRPALATATRPDAAPQPQAQPLPPSNPRPGVLGQMDLWNRPATSTGLLATCEYFPSKFRAAHRQRTRWVLGIAFLGWRQLGWRGDVWAKYMFFRDRKGILTAPLSMVAFFLLANALVVRALGGPERWGIDTAATALHQPWLQMLLVANSVLLTNRLGQRMWFVSRANGLQHGLLSGPRMIVSTFINFAAVTGAWRQWLRHLASGAPIAWDKTQHVFPTSAALAHHHHPRRRLSELLIESGAISPKDLEQALSVQRKSGAHLRQVLLDQGCVSAEAMADAVAMQDELPRAVRDSQPLPLAVASIDPEVIRNHRLVPIAVDANNILHVAVARRPTTGVTRAIRASSGYQVAYVVACDHEVQAWVDELAPQPSRPEPGS